MPLTETEALSKNPTTDDENSQFVGFHGTSQRFAQDLVKGVFDKSHFGAVTPGGIASLQFGIGLYVVKAEHPSDDNAFGLAQYFAEYPENHTLNFLYSIIGSSGTGWGG